MSTAIVERKQKRFRDDLFLGHPRFIPKLNGPRGKGEAWSVATGGWVPTAYLFPTYIFDPFLGELIDGHINDLDGKALHFAPKAAPRGSYLYFHTCCSVWKKEFLANPDCDDAAEFWDRFLGHLNTLWPAKYVFK